jgi:hypothetical protein
VPARDHRPGEFRRTKGPAVGVSLPAGARACCAGPPVRVSAALPPTLRSSEAPSPSAWTKPRSSIRSSTLGSCPIGQARPEATAVRRVRFRPDRRPAHSRRRLSSSLPRPQPARLSTAPLCLLRRRQQLGPTQQDPDRDESPETSPSGRSEKDSMDNDGDARRRSSKVER